MQPEDVDTGDTSHFTPFTMNTGLVTIDGTAPEIDALIAVQEQEGVVVDLFEPGEIARQGTVEISVDAFDALAGIAEDGVEVSVVLAGDETVSVPVTPGAIEPVQIGNEEWMRYHFEATIDAFTENGVYEVTAQARDQSGNESVVLEETIEVDKDQIGAVVELQGAVSGPFMREVVFAATDAGGAVLKSWTLDVEFSGGVGTAVLVNVPDTMAFLSAKAHFSLRVRLPAVLDTYGQAQVVFGNDNLLRGGDLTGDNSVTLQDNNILRSYWFMPNDVADITGDGSTTLGDLNILRENWLKSGDEL